MPLRDRAMPVPRPARASSRDRTRAVAVTAAALLLVGGLVTLLAWPDRDDTTHVVDATPAAPRADVHAPQPSPAPAPIVDPTPRAGPLADPLPPELEAVRARIDRGERLGNADLKPVYSWFVRHPEDARALLLLAHAYTDAEWYGDAVDRYRRAARLDPLSRQDDRMLPDLVRITAIDPHVSLRASAAIRDIYGADARPAVEAALAREQDESARRRLEHLAGDLGR